MVVVLLFLHISTNMLFFPSLYFRGDDGNEDKAAVNMSSTTSDAFACWAAWGKLFFKKLKTERIIWHTVIVLHMFNRWNTTETLSAGDIWPITTMPHQARSIYCLAKHSTSYSGITIWSELSEGHQWTHEQAMSGWIALNSPCKYKYNINTSIISQFFSWMSV